MDGRLPYPDKRKRRPHPFGNTRNEGTTVMTPEEIAAWAAVIALPLAAALVWYARRADKTGREILRNLQQILGR